MPRRRQLTRLATVINLAIDLNIDDQQTLIDVLRSRDTGPKSATAPAAAKSSATGRRASTRTPKGGAGTVAEQLAKDTGRSVADCEAALADAAGDKKAALMALTAS